MISLYLSEGTWLHRVPAGIKLIAIAVVSVLVLSTDQWPPLVFALSAAGLMAASLGSGGLRRVAGLRTLLPIIAAIGVLQAIFVSVDAALLSVLRISVMVMLADLVTITTPMQNMMLAIRPLLLPLKAFGVSPAKLSLAVALVIRFIPLLAAQWQAQRDAWRSRSARKPGLRLLVPFVAQALRRTDRVAESVAARSQAQTHGAYLSTGSRSQITSR